MSFPHREPISSKGTESLIGEPQMPTRSRRRSYQCQAPLRGFGVKTADKTFMSHSSEEGMLL